MLVPLGLFRSIVFLFSSRTLLRGSTNVEEWWDGLILSRGENGGNGVPWRVVWWVKCIYIGNVPSESFRLIGFLWVWIQYALIVSIHACITYNLMHFGWNHAESCRWFELQCKLFALERYMAGIWSRVVFQRRISSKCVHIFLFVSFSTFELKLR